MKLSTVLIGTLLLTSLILKAQTLPFPQHVTYKGGIKPTYTTQPKMDEDVQKLYDIWKGKYLILGCDTLNNHYFISFADSTNKINSTSEGHGYGMMIMAYMAGYDSKAKEIFDGMYAYWAAHQGKTANLMSWKQNLTCGIASKNSATDGDVDIAYALLLADKQWGSAGAINYKAKALDIMSAILTMNTYGNIVKLGDWYVNTDPKFGTSTRSSDFITDHFKAFKIASGNSKWGDIVNSCYSIIDSIHKNYSKSSGLLPDFIIKANSSPMPATANFLEDVTDGKYYYNACRVPWRIGTDYLVTGDAKAKNTVLKISNWLAGRAANDPNKIYSGYELNGYTITGKDYTSPVFIGPFAVGAMCDAKFQSFLNKMYDYLNDYDQKWHGYFENTVALLSMIVLTGNYWTPVDMSLAINDTYMMTPDISVTIYPNPTSGEVTISTELSKHEMPVTVSVINQQAQVVKQVFLTSDNTSIDLSDISKGLYFIQLENSQQRNTKKLVIK